ncbi:MAG TPA: FAD-binding protein [Candidatus Pullichristensenella stercoripullorum]|nr:FAD-binding protein [Candidatus Pullichristensenella stercoripullorum]
MGNIFTLDGADVAVRAAAAVVVGTGCAGYNAADCLYDYGVRDVLLVTDHRKGGTSRNTGSDKQTYYKLTLAGEAPDSVRAMARTLFEGGCVDGDQALCEAALSVKCFLKLCQMGVPFPTNRYGEYVGYKTDHDPLCRATSVGPLTSRRMTEALEASVEKKGIEVLDRHQAVAILTDEGRVAGVLCLTRTEPRPRYEAIFTQNVVYATGGPAGVYQDVCYPLGHQGMSGLLFLAGAAGKNLTEWQYGLASLRPRWNVSGTYMQALPRFVSTDAEGGDAREFLQDAIPDAGELLSMIFLKGYQWPFDARKAQEGSSRLDLLVYQETKCKGRRVWLDFTRDPLGDAFSLDALVPEAREYLRRSGALLRTPIERLRRMNAPAIDFYRSRGVDLARDMLEIALCAQHNNGGVAVDRWWQSGVRGLFVVGEAAGTHGVCRPGGSALNAGQVGSERAARYIAAHAPVAPRPEQSLARCREQIAGAVRLGLGALRGSSNLEEAAREAKQAMSRVAAAVRDGAQISALLETTRERLRGFAGAVRIAAPTQLYALYRFYDILISQLMCLAAMEDYIAHGGKSRGSAIYSDTAGKKPFDALPEQCRFTLDAGDLSGRVQETRLCAANWTVQCDWRDVRPIPEEDDVFETVWRAYRETGNVD